MQKRANYPMESPYEVEYVGFEDTFRADPDRIVYAHTVPGLQPLDSLHHHDAVEVGYCFSGSGIFSVDGALLPFSAPCATVLYPGQLHKARSMGEQESHWLFVTFRAESVFPRNARDLYNLPWDGALAQSALTTDPAIVSLAAAVAEEFEQGARDRDDCVRGLLRALLVRHGRLPRRPPGEGRERLTALTRLRPLLQYIDEHYTQELDAESLARQIHVHPATARDWFNSALGLTAMQYVHRVRISAACSLLRGTDAPVTAIAGQVGYRSLSAFNRHFQDVCHCTPTQYREHL